MTFADLAVGLLAWLGVNTLAVIFCAVFFRRTDRQLDLIDWEQEMADAEWLAP